MTNTMAIPKKTLSLIDRLATHSHENQKMLRKIPIGKPVIKDSSITKHSVATLRGPWKISPPPTLQQADEMHLFRLTVNRDKKKSWRIDVTDLTTGSTGVHQSGFGGAVAMNGQVKSGKEIADAHQGSN